jgi:hypothetical protein
MPKWRRIIFRRSKSSEKKKKKKKLNIIQSNNMQSTTSRKSLLSQQQKQQMTTKDSILTKVASNKENNGSDSESLFSQGGATHHEGGSGRVKSSSSSSSLKKLMSASELLSKQQGWTKQQNIRNDNNISPSSKMRGRKGSDYMKYSSVSPPEQRCPSARTIINNSILDENVDESSASLSSESFRIMEEMILCMRHLQSLLIISSLRRRRIFHPWTRLMISIAFMRSHQFLQPTLTLLQRRILLR